MTKKESLKNFRKPVAKKPNSVHKSDKDYNRNYCSFCGIQINGGKFCSDECRAEELLNYASVDCLDDEFDDFYSKEYVSMRLFDGDGEDEDLF